MKPLQLIPKFLCVLAFCLSIPTNSLAESYEDEPLPEEHIHLRHIWTYEYPENRGKPGLPVRIFRLSLDEAVLHNSVLTDLLVDTNVGMGVLRQELGTLDKILEQMPYTVFRDGEDEQAKELEALWDDLRAHDSYPTNDEITEARKFREIDILCIPGSYQDPETACSGDSLSILGATAIRHHFDPATNTYTHTTPREDILPLLAPAKPYPPVTFFYRKKRDGLIENILYPEASSDPAQQATEVRIMQEGTWSVMAGFRLTFPPGVLEGNDRCQLELDTHAGKLLLYGKKHIEAVRDPLQPNSLRVILYSGLGVVPGPWDELGVFEFEYTRYTADTQYAIPFTLNLVHDPFRALPVEVRRPVPDGALP